MLELSGSIECPSAQEWSRWDAQNDRSFAMSRIPGAFAVDRHKERWPTIYY
jgi:hypothetical protein